MGLTLAVMVSDHVSRLSLAGYRPRTIRARQFILAAFAQHIAPTTLLTATRRDIERFLSRPLAAASRRNYLMHLRGFYRWAVEEGHLAEDPTAMIGNIRVRHGQPRPITTNELSVALENAQPRMRAWLLLMSLAGLRCLEVAGLRPCDLIEAEDHAVLFLRECKGGGTGSVPAHEAIVEALRVLPIRDGQWWNVGAKTVSTEVGHYLRSVGIDASAHRLRHTSATAWYRASGHDLLTTAALLRHRDVSSTQIYAEIDLTRPAQVVDLVPRPSVSLEAALRGVLS